MALTADTLPANRDSTDINMLTFDNNHLEPTPNQLPEAKDIEGPNESEDSSEDEQNQPYKPRKITEKRRAQNAIFHAYVNDKAIRITKESLRAEARQAHDEELSIANILAGQQSPTIKDPREYQIELFERAKKENVIAVLDTGSGKTLIAVLLLRHVLDQEMQDREEGLPKRVSFFLVPSVALVFQQHAVLECNLSHKVSRRYGAMGSDGMEKKSWNKHVEKDMVIVCTAEILYQCLIHSFVKMEQINLIIFDEAHRAKKNAPYAKIIRDFYIESKLLPRRPRIFGMTASPVDAKVDIVEAARELEDLLQCKIATYPLSDEHKNKAKEIIAYYPQLSHPFETTLYQKLYVQFGSMHNFKGLFTASKAASSDIGAWGSDQFWSFALKDEQVKKAKAKVEREYNQRHWAQTIEGHNEDMELLRQAAEIVSKHSFHDPTDTKDDLSPKVRVLHRILQEHFKRPTDTRCMIFVTRKSTARLLFEIFQVLGGPNLKPGLLTGLSTHVGEASMSFRQQVLTLKQFKTGQLNCIFATSVAEEGLDVPACNLVIRFDLYRTMIEYIQSKGRARHPHSKFIDLLEKNNLLHRQVWLDARDRANAMREWCKNLPSDRVIGRSNDSMPEDVLNQGRSFTHPKSGAKLTYGASLGVLDMFTSTLPSKDNSTPLMPHYVPSLEAGKYVYEVILPETSPIRFIRGRRYRRKLIAKQSAAFEMVTALLKGTSAGSYIDEHLLSTYKKKLHPWRNAQVALNEKKGSKYPVRLKPSLWAQGRGTIPMELYLTVLNTNDSLDRHHQPLGLLTRTRVPDFPQFPIFLNSGRITKVVTKSIHRPLGVKSDVVDKFTVVTHRFWKDVNNKIFEIEPSKMSYWVVPLVPHCDSACPDAYIDWNAVNIIFETEEIEWTPDLPHKELEGKFAIDRDSGSGRFFLTRAEPALTPLSPVPEGVVKPWGSGGKIRKDILDYSNSLWGKSRYHMHTVWRHDQPVFEAELVILHQNMLAQPPPKGKREGERVTKAYLCAEPLRISALPPTAVEMWLLFPAIIHRLEEYLIALEGCQIVDVKVNPAFALEAFTKDSDNSGNHSEEKINFRPGMGNNYERFEFIGDCFLKMATSISLFSRFPDDNEFDYHCKRMVMICNKNLFDAATSDTINLPEYIRSLSFDRATWYPEALEMLRGKGWKNRGQEYTHRLGDKSIADVCEALIGAAFIQYNKPGVPWTPETWDPAVRAVTTFVRNEDHEMNCWADYLRAYEIPAYQTAKATAAQRHLSEQVEKGHDYHFKYPRLLRSAFCHPSQPYSWELIPSYQRLEFLGDSLLDTACVTHLFYRYPDKDPQWLTEHKMAMVANKFLGALCVKLGFHCHLRYNQSQVQFQIYEYVTEIQDAVDNSGGAMDYWVGVKDPPKCLPDMVESYVGAIFVDSNFNYNEVQRFFDMHMKPYFEDMTIYDTFANSHPTTHLHNKLSIQLGCVDYRLLSQELIMEAPGVKPKVISALMIHDKVVCDSIRESSRYAKVAVSKKALEMLDGLAPFEFRAMYACDCKDVSVDGLESDGDKGGVCANLLHAAEEWDNKIDMVEERFDIGTAI